MVSQTWIIESLKMYNISDRIINFLANEEGGINSAWKNLSGGKNSKRHLPGRLAFTTAIHCISESLLYRYTNISEFVFLAEC